MKDILNQITILTTQITLWSGRKRLKEEDLKLADGSELPPAALASLGSKKVMDPAALAVFERLKRRAEREILAVGTRFLNGYAVPRGALKELMPKLVAIEEEFDKAKQAFLAEYDEAVESWITANPGWEEVIRRSVEDAGYVGRQLNFAIQAFQITPPRAHRSGLEKEVGGLAGQLRQEIAQMAHACWESSFENRTEVGQRALRPVRAMARKMEGLTFLEPGLHELVAGIQMILDALPTAGPVKGANFASVCGVLSLLGDIPAAREAALSSVEETEEDEELEIASVTTPAAFPAQWF